MTASKNRNMVIPVVQGQPGSKLNLLANWPRLETRKQVSMSMSWSATDKVKVCIQNYTDILNFNDLA